MHLPPALQKCDIKDPKLQHLIMAMAMQETNHCDVAERDPLKDGWSNGGANSTAFNLSTVSHSAAAEAVGLMSHGGCHCFRMTACEATSLHAGT